MCKRGILFCNSLSSKETHDDYINIEVIVTIPLVLKWINHSIGEGPRDIATLVNSIINCFVFYFLSLFHFVHHVICVFLKVFYVYKYYTILLPHKYISIIYIQMESSPLHITSPHLHITLPHSHIIYASPPF